MTDKPVFSSPLGDTITWETGEEETGGAFSVHIRTAPPSAQSAPHVHPNTTEAFVVLEGEFEFEIDGVSQVARPGDYVRAPAGISHGWRVVGDDDARCIVIFTPSARRAYFEELDALTRKTNGSPDVRDVVSLSRKYGWL